jgi:hypothetical protein
MVVAASQVILRSNLAGIDDSGTKKEIAFDLAVVEAVVLVADGIVLLSDAPLQSVSIQEQSSQIG